VCVCMLCFKNDEVDLGKCLFSTHNFSPSNLVKHMERNHSTVDAPDFFKLTSSGRGKVASLHTSDESKRSRTPNVTDCGSSIRTYFNNMTSLEAYELWCRKTHKFYNRCGLPFRSASSNEFRELMSFTVENASLLKSYQDRLIVGHHKISQLSRKRLEELVFVVSSLVKDSGDYFRQVTGKLVPRLCVSHDIWESKNGHWLGVTLFMVDVTNWEMLSFPIGFRRSKGKKAKEVFEQVQDIIKRYVAQCFTLLYIFYIFYLTNCSTNFSIDKVSIYQQRMCFVRLAIIQLLQCRLVD
jgi:hypothetical protein